MSADIPVRSELKYIFGSGAGKLDCEWDNKEHVLKVDKPTIITKEWGCDPRIIHHGKWDQLIANDQL